MNMVTKFAVQTLMKRTHPTINRRECWGARPHKEKCTACVDICPYAEDIFRRPGALKSWDKCTDCGLCVAVCKTRCIAPSRQAVDADTSLVELPNDIVWVGCKKSTRQNDLVRECIGAISWETMAYLALAKKVVLDVTPCGECENVHCAELLRKNLERMVDFLGQAKFEARVALAYEQEELPFVRQEFTRRDLMGKMTDGSRVNSKKLLRKMPFLQNGDDAHQYDFRKMLYDRVKYLKSKAETPATYGFKLPVVNDSCYGCEKCVKACKTNALELIPLEGEGNRSRLVVTPWKCSECEQCVISCSEKAMEGLALRQVSSLGPVAIKTIEIHLCPSCGKAKKPNPNREICVTCDIRERSRKRQAEAKERHEQRKAKIIERQKEKEAKEAAEAAEAATQAALQSGEQGEVIDTAVAATAVAQTVTEAVEKTAAKKIIKTAAEKSKQPTDGADEA